MKIINYLEAVLIRCLHYLLPRLTEELILIIFTKMTDLDHLFTKQIASSYLAVLGIKSVGVLK